jgi:hypothetical protein
MAESVTLGNPAIDAEPDAVAVLPLGVIVRDIARGGLGGLAVGVIVGGIGGRVAMRLIALLVPGSTGAFTENGNRIGDITLDGSIAVVFFGGLFAGIFVGTIWVVVSPWLPRALGRRVVAATLLAIGLGTFGVIQGSNSDFIVLRFDPRVVLVLLALVGLVGASMAIVDDWLERRLPWPRSATSRSAGAYLAVTALGTFFAFGVVATFLADDLRPVGVALLLTGVATVSWWYLRFRGAARPPLVLRLVGSGGVIAAAALGLFLELPEIRRALGIF